MSSNGNEQTIATLHTLFIIVYLQEMAWVSAPLLISANVFVHAIIRQFSIDSLIFSSIIFAFFLITGLALTISLYFAHSVALKQIRPAYFLPYAVVKAVRIVTMLTLSFIILFSPKLIKTYFYASIYGLFETVAGAVALEVTCRCIRETRRIQSGRRRQTPSDVTLPAHVVSKTTLIHEGI
ncbi:unnamed protein product [Caenorhabditis bovis]|uniref:Uncharacterized protein n=1 Tax=Caenorhabditis bovis TaxID=2654633 RepID=A0A8S1FFY4_9PELO|nr:unnamed protein product [Caenorhabditis bovis]